MSRNVFVRKIKLEKFHTERKAAGVNISETFSPSQTKIAERERERVNNRAIILLAKPFKV